MRFALPLSLLLALAASAEEPPFRIGALYALSSWAATGGSAELEATKLAVSEVNSSGGIRGRKIELVVEDTQSDFKKTVSAMQKLASVDQVPVILGPNWAEFSEVAAPVAQQKGVLLLTASGYTKDLTKDRPLVFTTLPAHSFFTKPFSEFVAKRGLKKLLLIKTENGYTESIASAIQEQLKELGNPIARVESFSNSEQDFRSSILKTKSAGYDGVIVVLVQDNGLGLYFRQAKELGLKAKLFSTNSIPYDSSIKDNPALVDGVTFFNLRALATPDFTEKYRRFTSVTLVDTAPRAYDNVYLLKDAIERCGFEQNQIAKCLMDTKYSGMAGKIVFDQTRNVLPQVEMTEILVGQAGTFVSVTK